MHCAAVHASGCWLGATGAGAVVAAIESCRQLTHLNLERMCSQRVCVWPCELGRCHSYIGRGSRLRGCSELACAFGLSVCDWVDVVVRASGNEVGTDGGTALAKAMNSCKQFKQLTSLNLSRMCWRLSCVYAHLCMTGAAACCVLCVHQTTAWELMVAQLWRRR